MGFANSKIAPAVLFLPLTAKQTSQKFNSAFTIATAAKGKVFQYHAGLKG